MGYAGELKVKSEPIGFLATLKLLEVLSQLVVDLVISGNDIFFKKLASMTQTQSLIIAN
jgi:hypothetical protein